MKKILSLLLIGTFAMAMAGCVKIDEDPYTVDCDQFPTHPTCLDDVDPDDPEGPGIINVLDTFPTAPVEITFWHVYGASKSELLDEFIAEFIALHPNVTITSVSQGNYTDINNNLVQAISSKGSLPTIVIGYPDHVAEYLKGNAVIPLDDFIKSATWGIDLDDFIDSYLEENQQYPGGYMYSFPYSKSTEMMVYNKDVIDANAAAITAALGEPFPTDRALTWAELDLLTPILVDPNWNPASPTADKCEVLVNFDSPANFFINNVRMWQGGYTNSDGDILVDNANTKSMLTYVNARFTDRTFALPLFYEDSQGYGSTHFIAGDVCMSVGSTAGINYNIPTDGSFEVGVVPVPQYDLAHKSAVQQGPNISILSKSTDAQRLVAWEFIKYLITSENTAAWAMDTGYLPVRKTGFNSTEYQEFLAIDSITNKKYYSSLAAQAALLQKDYYEYDPAFAGAYTSSDARDKADVAMEALFAGNSVQAVIDDMLSQLGVN